MKRLDRLVKLVKQEQEAVRLGSDPEVLLGMQGRLRAHLLRTAGHVPAQLFSIRPQEGESEMEMERRLR